jgi:polar amino acid transport system substrate-binding protein
MRSVLLPVTLLLACLLGKAWAGQEIMVAADPWCPYNCEEESSTPGFAIEVLREALAPAGISVRYQVMPWSRAVLEAQKGNIDGVVEATAQAAADNGLSIGKEPMGYTTFCLFVAADNPLDYRRAADLARLASIGLVTDYDYGTQFGPQLAQPEIKGNLIHISGNKTAERLIRMLQKNRIQGFIENEYVARYTLDQLELQHTVRAAGCAEPHPGYIAFSAKGNQEHDFTGKLDEGISRLRDEGRLAEILARYNLTDWQPEVENH